MKKTLFLTILLSCFALPVHAGDVRNFCNYFYKTVSKTQCVSMQQEAQRWLEIGNRSPFIVDYCTTLNTLKKGITTYVDYHASRKCYIEEQQRREANDALRDSGGGSGSRRSIIIR